MLSLLLDKAQHLQELQSIQQKLITDNSSSNIDSAVEDPPPPPLPPQTQTQALVPNAKGSKNSMSKLSEFSKVRQQLHLMIVLQQVHIKWVWLIVGTVR